MASNWLDLMDNDSNLSLSEDENTRPGIATVSASRASFDAELDSSRCGVNLLIKKKMNILSEDSLSRKRSLNEMKSTDIDRFIAKMSRSPPKAKQKVNAQGRWTKTKTNKDATRIGFERFLNWADRDQSGSNNRCVLSSSSIDNKRNIVRHPTASNLVLCTPKATNRRAHYRGRRTRKLAEHSADQSPAARALSVKRGNTRNGAEDEEEEEEDDDMEQAAGKRGEHVVVVAAATHNKSDTKLATKESEGAETAQPTLRRKESGNGNGNENEEQRLQSDHAPTTGAVTAESGSTNDHHPDTDFLKGPQGVVGAEREEAAEDTLEDGTRMRTMIWI